MFGARIAGNVGSSYAFGGVHAAASGFTDAVSVFQEALQEFKQR